MLKKPRIAASWEAGQELLRIVDNDRDRLLLRLCLYQALREGEILGNKYSIRKDGGQLKPLTLGDLDLAHRTITITGKGGSKEIVFIDATTFELLTKWIKKTSFKSAKQKLFHLSPRQFENVVKDLAKKARLENWVRYGPHTLRAISITYYITKTDLSRARYHARHSTTKTTALYDRPDLDTRRLEESTVFDADGDNANHDIDRKLKPYSDRWEREDKKDSKDGKN